MPYRAQQRAARRASWRLLALFALVVLALLVATNLGLAAAYRLIFPWTGSFPQFFFETNTAVLLLFVIGGCCFEQMRLREGGPHVARLAGGRKAGQPGAGGSAPAEKRLLNIIDELVIAAGMPKRPQAWVLPHEQAINAFAAGWGPDDAVVAVTQGALERLTREELQGVVAHELAHLQHGDTLLRMQLVGMVWGLQMVHTLGLALWERGRERGLQPVWLAFGGVLIAAGFLGWLAARLLTAAVSRQREFLADAAAAQSTRNPDGLGGALRKIAYQAVTRQQAIQRPQAQAVSHLFFHSWLSPGWWASHPPVAERLRRLYGHTAGPLPAPTLPIDEEDLDSPTQPASLLPEGWNGSQSFPAELLVRASAEGMPVPESVLSTAPGDLAADADADERQALEEMLAWERPGERHAAALALLLDPEQPAELAAWRAEARSLAPVELVLAQVGRLGPGARLPALEQLLQRIARGTLAERRLLLEAARRVMGAAGRLAPEARLRWLVARHLLASDATTAGRRVPDLAMDAVAVVSAFLARIVVPEREAPAWWRVVMQVLRPGESPAWHKPATSEVAQALRELAALDAAQRALLLRTWAHAALQISPGQPLSQLAADALRMTAILLDTPKPAAVAGKYIRIRETEPDLQPATHAEPSKKEITS